METIKGRPVTDKQIQDWSDEAEAGYDVALVKKRGRKPKGDAAAKVVPVRLEPALVEILDKRAEDEHVSRSEVIREAIRAYVS